MEMPVDDDGREEETQRLSAVLYSMNANGSDRCGDFQCLYTPSRISHTLGWNLVLRAILQNIASIVDEDGDGHSTLDINLSCESSRGAGEARRRRLHATSALTGFLHQSETKNQGWNFLGLRSLIESLPKKVEMLRVDVSRCALGDVDAIELSNALLATPSVIELNASYNQIGTDGYDAIVSDLLSDPSCRIRKIDLQWNWNMGSADPYGHSNLVQALHKNRSLTELNLAGTRFEASADLARVFCDFSDDGYPLFDIPAKYNHHLQTLKMDGDGRVGSLLLSALKMNEGNAQEAIARKVDHHLEKKHLFKESEDPDMILRTLEVVGRCCSLASMLKSVQRFTAEGSLFS